MQRFWRYGCIRCNNWVNDLNEVVKDKKEAKQSELVSLNNKIKEEYDIDKVEDEHIKYFFRDVLKDASTNLERNQ